MTQMINAPFRLRNLPYALIIMAVGLSVAGMVEQQLDRERIMVLAALHAVFTRMLTGTLQHIIDEGGNLGKQITAGILGACFLAFDVYLVHYGLEWAFEAWTIEAIIAGSIAFGLINVFSHWSFSPSQPSKTDADDAESAAGNVERLRSRL